MSLIIPTGLSTELLTRLHIDISRRNNRHSLFTHTSNFSVTQ
jgi:hypothetical protein